FLPDRLGRDLLDDLPEVHRTEFYQYPRGASTRARLVQAARTEKGSADGIFVFIQTSRFRASPPGQRFTVTSAGERRWRRPWPCVGSSPFSAANPSRPDRHRCSPSSFPPAHPAAALPA